METILHQVQTEQTLDQLMPVWEQSQKRLQSKILVPVT